MALPRTFHALKSVPLNFVAGGTEFTLDARVWCECFYRDLKAKESMRVVSGIRAAASLTPARGDLSIERLWVINNHTCSLFKPDEVRKHETEEGPCWEPGSSVDVVALIVNTQTHDTYLLRGEELAVTIQVVFEKFDVVTVTLRLLLYFLITIFWTSFKTLRRA